jgi:hypothetical protein
LTNRRNYLSESVGCTTNSNAVPVAQPDRREVSDVSCGEPTDAEILSERHDRCVDEAQAEIGISPINLHGPRKLVQPRRGVRECPKATVRL